MSQCNWTDGAPVVYHSYAPPSTSHVTERCVVINVSRYGQGTCAWYEVACDSLHAVVCSRLYLGEKRICHGIMFSPFSPFLTISLYRVGHYFSYVSSISDLVPCNVFSQLVCLHVYLYYVVPPSLFSRPLLLLP